MTHTVSVELSGTGVFMLDTVDFGCGNGASGNCIGTVEGILSGGQQFLLSTGLLPNNGTFSTFDPNVTSVTIDALHISIDRNDSNIDNMVLNMASVPEPAIFALLGLGITGLGYHRRKRIKMP